MANGSGGDIGQVPGPDASIDDILRFAGTYNAYERLVAEPEPLERMFWPGYEGIEHSSVVPDWVRVDLARALLFYAYRRDRFAGGYGPYDPMRALVERIRTLSDEPARDEVAPLPSSATGSSTGSATNGDFSDSWEYSEDGVYRWWYERRWSPAPTLCFVGLNPATGDTDGKPRPTLRKVVGWARREGCGAVVVVNLFAFRATKPDELFRAEVDIVGDRNTEMIQTRSADASLTLAAWGAHPLAQMRAAAVVPLLTKPQCVGMTKSGAPKHPLYVPAAREFEPYR